MYQKYRNEGCDTIILVGAEYGSGSSRDWAAKGPMLLVHLWRKRLLRLFLYLTNTFLHLFYAVSSKFVTTWSESCDFKEL